MEVFLLLIVIPLLTRIDCLMNNDLVERVNIILKNTFDFKEQKVVLEGCWGFSRLFKDWNIVMENGQEKDSSKACIVGAQPSTLSRNGHIRTKEPLFISHPLP